MPAPHFSIKNQTTMSPSSPALKQAPKPDWLKIRPPGGEAFAQIKDLVKSLKLHTVCEEARCPNMAECWGGGTATLMLMGDTCTRGCKFCHVKTGNPKGLLDKDEPEKVARALGVLKLKYVVLTSVDRDDLPDGGADHFAKTVEAIKKAAPETIVEVLIPDFLEMPESLNRIAFCGAEVIAHNIETVSRLTRKVRDGRCDYQLSLNVLKKVKAFNPKVYTKSSIMLGLGETKEEVLESMEDLRKHEVDVLTLGQYLRPTDWHLPVEEYIHPTVFKELEEEGLKRGFLCCPSGPLVRSSYRAGEKFLEGLIRAGKTL